MALTVTSIISEFGAFYKAGSQNLKSLHTQIFDRSSTDELFTMMPTEDTRIEGAKVDIGNVLQAYQDTFTPYGDTTFVGRKINLYPIKADLSENPTKLEKTWLGFLASTGNDRKTWPFVRWWMEMLIFPAMKQDWELNGVYRGTVGAITPGTPNPILTGVLGLRKQINDDITATSISPIVLGAVPATDTDAGNKALVDYVESFVKAIPSKFLPFLDKLAMNDTNFRRYKAGMRYKYNMYHDQADQTKVIDTNLEVKGYTSMSTSTKLITTIKGNMAMGIKKPANQSIFEIESVDRTVKIFTDFHKGVGYFRPDYMFTNDVDMV